MELVALRTFKAVVEEGGVLAASRRLNTVQSNVTTRIRRLEEELGATLFFRKGRGLELAPPGRVLLEFADRMLQLERQTAAAVRQVGAETGELRIGSMETFAALHLPRGLMRLRELHPGVDLRVVTDTSEALVDGVLAHRLDCAFVAGPLEDARLVCETVAEEELVCASVGGSSGLPLILFRAGCAYRARAIEWQRQLGQSATQVMEMGTLEGILGCVGAGVGWTLLPRRVIEQSRHGGKVVLTPVPAALARVPTLMVRHRDSPPLRAADSLAASVACGEP
ncbi:MAG: LysR family transcriptional regulator [Rhodocyclaceae bacterium]|nr:LysR family transcriptional regulator [Rhodocyclaceae bacterium]